MIRRWEAPLKMTECGCLPFVLAQKLMIVHLGQALFAAIDPCQPAQAQELATGSQKLDATTAQV